MPHSQNFDVKTPSILNLSGHRVLPVEPVGGPSVKTVVRKFASWKALVRSVAKPLSTIPVII